MILSGFGHKICSLALATVVLTAVLVRPEAPPPWASPGAPAHGYGFMPESVAAALAARKAASRAGASEHTPAVRVIRVARTGGKGVMGNAKGQDNPHPKDGREAAPEAADARRWRLGFKRAWIKEELRGLQARAQAPQGPSYRCWKGVAH